MNVRSDSRKVASSTHAFESNISNILDRGFASILPANNRDTIPGGRRRVAQTLPTLTATVADGRRSSTTAHQVPRGNATLKPQRRKSLGSSPSESKIPVQERAVVKHCNPTVSDTLQALETTISSNLEHGFDTILPATCSTKSRRTEGNNNTISRSPRRRNVTSCPTFGNFPSQEDETDYEYGDQAAVDMDTRKTSTVSRYDRDSFSRSYHDGAPVTAESRGVARRRNSLGSSRSSPSETERPKQAGTLKKTPIVSRSVDAVSPSKHTLVAPAQGARRVACRRISLTSAIPASNDIVPEHRQLNHVAAQKYSMVPRHLDSFDSLSRSVHSVPEPAAKPRRIVRRRSSLTSSSHVGADKDDWNGFSAVDFEEPTFDATPAPASPTTPPPRAGAKKSAGRISMRRYRLSNPAVIKAPMSPSRDESSQSTEDTTELTASSQHSSSSHRAHMVSPRSIDAVKIPRREKRQVPRPNVL